MSCLFMSLVWVFSRALLTENNLSLLFSSLSTIDTPVPFYLFETSFFFCHFGWLAVLINLDREKNLVWLVSPYKCSPLIKLKFCSLSVTSISVCFAVFRSSYRNLSRRLKCCTDTFHTPKTVKTMFFLHLQNVQTLYLHYSCNSPPLMSHLFLGRDLSLRIRLWHVAGRKPCWTPECLSDGKTAREPHSGSNRPPHMVLLSTAVWRHGIFWFQHLLFVYLWPFSQMLVGVFEKGETNTNTTFLNMLSLCETFLRSLYTP